MTLFLTTALLFALLTALSLYRGWFNLQLWVKPAVIVCLAGWLYVETGWQGAALWFGVGLLFSLAGDVFLMFSAPHFFMVGLASFLLAHLFYVLGFNLPLPQISMWSVIFAVLVGWGGAKIMRRILMAVTANGQHHLRWPIVAYGMVISVMLLSALLKLNDLSWGAGAALLAAVGAFLFYLSDILLAWNKFVTPILHGRIYNIALYHLGQIILVAGVIAQLKLP